MTEKRAQSCRENELDFLRQASIAFREMERVNPAVALTVDRQGSGWWGRHGSASQEITHDKHDQYTARAPYGASAR